MKNIINKIKHYKLTNNFWNRIYQISMFLIVVFILISLHTQDYKEQTTDFNNQASQYQEIDEKYKNTVKATYPIIISAYKKSDIFKKEITGNGTAFFITESLILTNAHNVISDDKTQITGYKLYINGGFVDLKLLRYDTRSDLAILYTVDYENNYTIPFCQKDFKIGQTIHSFGYGYPFTINGSLKNGFKNTSNAAFSYRDNPYNYTNSIVSLDIYAGDSGSPVLKDDENCFAGVVNAGNGDRRMAIVVSHHNIKRFLTETYLYLTTK